MTKPIVSIVLGSYNRRPFLRSTLESVRNNGQDFAYEIIVVDGGSSDGSLNYLTKQKEVITIIQHNHGEFRGKKIERRSWGYFMNLAFKAAQGKYILMISDDCLVTPNSISNGVNYFEELLSQGENIGAMAFYWRNFPEQKEYFIGSFCDRIFVNHGLYLKSVLEQVNYFNEDDFKFYYADSDLCLRIIDSGYKIVDSPTSFVEHYSHANLKQRIKNESHGRVDEEIFLSKWKKLGVPESNCKTLSYIDPNNTVKKYWKLQIWIKYILRILNLFNLNKLLKSSNKNFYNPKTKIINDGKK